MLFISESRQKIILISWYILWKGSTIIHFQEFFVLNNFFFFQGFIWRYPVDKIRIYVNLFFISFLYLIKQTFIAIFHSRGLWQLFDWVLIEILFENKDNLKKNFPVKWTVKVGQTKKYKECWENFFEFALIINSWKILKLQPLSLFIVSSLAMHRI